MPAAFGPLGEVINHRTDILMKRPTRQQIERAANAIKFMVPLYCDKIDIKGDALASWTTKGLTDVKWPKSFGPNERKLIRLIARTILSGE